MAFFPAKTADSRAAATRIVTRRAMTLGMGALALEPGCRHVRCHHKNEAIVKKGQNNINVLGANE